MKLFRRPAEFFEQYALVVLLAAECVFFSLNSATPQFLTSANVTNILSNQSLLGIIAIATVLPLVANQIDLSVGPTAGLSSLLTAGLMSKSGFPLLPAMLVGISLGVAVGIVNGLLVARAEVNSIVTTLGTSSIIGAIVVWYSNGISISTGISSTLIDIGTGKWIGIPKPFFFLVGIAVLVWYVLEHTPLGRYLYSVGSSPRAAELVGLSVRRLVMGSFIASGTIAGAAGLLFVATQGSANPQIGANFTLPAVAAAFLGATCIKTGRYNVWGTFTAVFFLAVMVDGLTLWGVAGWVSDFFNGVALITAVAITTYSGRRRRARIAPTKSEAMARPVPSISAAGDEAPPLSGATVSTDGERP
jgi:ribose transport system permease protein